MDIRIVLPSFMSTLVQLMRALKLRGREWQIGSKINKFTLKRGSELFRFNCRELANTTHPRKGVTFHYLGHIGLGYKKHNTNSIYLTPASSRRGSLTDSKTGPKINKQLYRKTFSHDVSKLKRGRHMKNPDLSQGNLLANKMNINLNVLRSPMTNWIGSHVNCTDIVIIDDRSL